MRDYVTSFLADVTHGAIKGGAEKVAEKTMEKILRDQRAELLRLIMTSGELTQAEKDFFDARWQETDAEHRENRLMNLVCKIIFKETKRDTAGIRTAIESLREEIEQLKGKGPLLGRMRELEKELKALESRETIEVGKHPVQTLKELLSTTPEEFFRRLKQVEHDPFWEGWRRKVATVDHGLGRVARPIAEFNDWLGEHPRRGGIPGKIMQLLFGNRRRMRR